MSLFEIKLSQLFHLKQPKRIQVEWVSVEFRFSIFRLQTVFVKQLSFSNSRCQFPHFQIQYFFLFVLNNQKLASTRSVSNKFCQDNIVSWTLPCVTYHGLWHITFWGYEQRRSGPSASQAVDCRQCYVLEHLVYKFVFSFHFCQTVTVSFQVQT